MHLANRIARWRHTTPRRASPFFPFRLALLFPSGIVSLLFYSSIHFFRASVKYGARLPAQKSPEKMESCGSQGLRAISAGMRRVRPRKTLSLLRVRSCVTRWRNSHARLEARLKMRFQPAESIARIGISRPIGNRAFCGSDRPDNGLQSAPAPSLGVKPAVCGRVSGSVARSLRQFGQLGPTFKQTQPIRLYGLEALSCLAR